MVRGPQQQKRTTFGPVPCNSAMRQIVNSATLLSLICGAVPPGGNQTDAPTQQVSSVNSNETAQERMFSTQHKHTHTHTHTHTHIYDDITASQ
jgi:hypothetical protein